MSEIQAKKFSTQTQNGNIQFWANTDRKTTQRLQLDDAGNLCFGTKELASESAHIPPPDGIAPMYSARAWGHIITDASTGAIDATATKSKNVSSVVWDNKGQLKITFPDASPMPSTSYIVVANCNLNSTNPLLVSKVNAASTASIMVLKVFDAAAVGGVVGFAPPEGENTFLNFGLNATAYPQLLDFAVFA